MANAETWDGLQASVNQALEWGIGLSGALAERHDAGDVVGGIGPRTISRPRFGPPTLPASGMPGDVTQPLDVRSEQRSDVADLAAAVLGIIEEPPGVVAVALTGGPMTAVALGERLQEAQRALGLPVAPIPFAGATNADVGGAPIEVPPPGVAPVDGVPAVVVAPSPAAAVDTPSAPSAEARFDPDALARQPNLRLMAVILIVALLIALAIGVGWG